MNVLDKIDYISESVPLSERLAQLAEECSELAQAALKLRRTLSDDNPTPISAREGERQLAEEFGDVCLCIGALGTSGSFYRAVVQTYNRKLDRWVQRLEAANGKSRARD